MNCKLGSFIFSLSAINDLFKNKTVLVYNYFDTQHAGACVCTVCGGYGHYCTVYTFVNCGYLKFFLLLRLKNLVEYSYFLPKDSVKILQE